MFTPRQILYITPFYFKNGNTCKPKYFVVLAREGDKTIIASLPTRTNHIPAFVTQVHGCINHDDRCYNVYVFESCRVVGETGFYFPDPHPTFIYGNEVDTYELDILHSNYNKEGVDYRVKDLLRQDEYEALIKCLHQSTSVKRKVKRFLPKLN